MEAYERKKAAGATGSADTSSATADLRRRSQRKSTRCLAYVVLPGSRKETECVVLDMSASGAKLKLVGVTENAFAPRIELPREFRLILRNDKVEVDCSLAWSRGATCGVSFSSVFRPVR